MPYVSPFCLLCGKVNGIALFCHHLRHQSLLFRHQPGQSVQFIQVDVSGRIGCLFPFLCLLFFLLCILLPIPLEFMSADGNLHGIPLYASLVHVLLQICDLTFQCFLDHFILCGQMCGNRSVF